MMANSESAAPVIKLFGKTIIQTEDKGPAVVESASPASASAAEKVLADEEMQALRAGLPCPRCKSKETKFSYFNNYNVNQPRHFCKACHRYWTAGGTLRNVPIGAGRRKNHRPPSSSTEASTTAASEEEVMN